MTKLIHLVALVSVLCVGCVSAKNKTQNGQVALVLFAPGKQLLSIAKREKVGIWGPEGYVGSRTAGYWAALEGDGPVFVNPHFQDDSSDLPCVGTIALDMARRTVTLDLHRVVSRPGEAKRTKPHPANGMYHIETVRDARPGEAWF